MASVKLTDVKKIYDNKVTAVHDFNLEIADKEFVVLQHFSPFQLQFWLCFHLLGLCCLCKKTAFPVGAEGRPVTKQMPAGLDVGWEIRLGKR